MAGEIARRHRLRIVHTAEMRPGENAEHERAIPVISGLEEIGTGGADRCAADERARHPARIEPCSLAAGNCTLSREAKFAIEEFARCHRPPSRLGSESPAFRNAAFALTRRPEIGSRSGPIERWGRARSASAASRRSAAHARGISTKTGTSPARCCRSRHRAWRSEFAVIGAAVTRTLPYAADLELRLPPRRRASDRARPSAPESACRSKSTVSRRARWRHKPRFGRGRATCRYPAMRRPPAARQLFRCPSRLPSSRSCPQDTKRCCAIQKKRLKLL